MLDLITIVIVLLSATLAFVVAWLVRGSAQKKSDVSLLAAERELEQLRTAQLEMSERLERVLEEKRQLETLSAVDQERLTALHKQLSVAQQSSAEVAAVRDSLQFRLSEALQTVEKHKGAEQAATEQLQHSREALAEMKQVQREQQLRLEELQTENARLHTRQKEKEEHFAQQLQQLDEQKAVLKKEFENLANRIFEDKGKSFSEHSRQSLDALLNPFKQQINDFRAKVEDIHHKDTQQQAQLKAELKQLQELNKQITEEAHQLATALKGQKKMQGNWGELVLENVLDRSGLQAGKDYKREVSFNTENGRARPDAIVYLPENKHLVIDAKVSLNAYTRYVNAEDELEREKALSEHVAAVAGRIKELSDRNYFELPGLNSPEMVFMFIPIESAFVEALKGDETLFQKALEQNVLVATPTTLLTSLNIVRQLWRFEDQNKHTAELADKAGKVYDKLRTFLASMLDLGKTLDRSKEHYDKALGQLHTGPGNLIKQASEFKKLGVSVKAELPADLVEQADLELMSHDEVEDSPSN